VGLIEKFFEKLKQYRTVNFLDVIYLTASVIWFN